MKTRFFNLNFSSGTVIKNAILEIYDIFGKKVKNVVITELETTVDREGLTNGICFYNIINNNESIEKGKIIAQ